MAIRPTGQMFVLCVAMMVSRGAAGMGAVPSDHDSGAGEAEKKLTERLAVLEEIAQLELAAYRGGHTSLMALLSARRDFLQAKLELTKEPARRIEVLDAHVKLAKEIEATVQKLVELNQVSKVDFLKAKAARLKAEADLAKEQSPR